MRGHVSVAESAEGRCSLNQAPPTPRTIKQAKGREDLLRTIQEQRNHFKRAVAAYAREQARTFFAPRRPLRALRAGKPTLFDWFPCS